MNEATKNEDVAKKTRLAIGWPRHVKKVTAIKMRDQPIKILERKKK